MKIKMRQEFGAVVWYHLSHVSGTQAESSVGEIISCVFVMPLTPPARIVSISCSRWKPQPAASEP